MVKNLQAGNLFKAVIISVLFNTYRWWRYLLTGKIGTANAVCKAHLDFIKNLKKTVQKRQEVLKRRKRTDSDLYKLGVMATIKQSFNEEIRLAKIWKDPYYK